MHTHSLKYINANSHVHATAVLCTSFLMFCCSRFIFCIISLCLCSHCICVPCWRAGTAAHRLHVNMHLRRECAQRHNLQSPTQLVKGCDIQSRDIACFSHQPPDTHRIRHPAVSCQSYVVVVVVVVVVIVKRVEAGGTFLSNRMHSHNKQNTMQQQQQQQQQQ